MQCLTVAEVGAYMPNFGPMAKATELRRSGLWALVLGHGLAMAPFFMIWAWALGPLP